MLTSLCTNIYAWNTKYNAHFHIKLMFQVNYIVVEDSGSKEVDKYVRYILNLYTSNRTSKIDFHP